VKLAKGFGVTALFLLEYFVYFEMVPFVLIMFGIK
jgi:hypothetical protein